MVHGTQNCADLTTKPLTSDYIDGFCNCVGCRFPDGEDEMAFQINNVELSVDMVGTHQMPEKWIHRLQGELRLHRRLCGWQRVDLDSRCARTSGKQGPPWGHVVARITSDAKSGDIMFVESTKLMAKEDEHRKISQDPMHIMTTLIYTAPKAEPRAPAIP